MGNVVANSKFVSSDYWWAAFLEAVWSDVMGQGIII